MGAVLLNSAGKPEPSPEIKRRLRQLHPGLGLEYTPGNDRTWLIIMGWERDDPRWEMVKRQEMSANDAWDVIGHLPIGCNPDEAAPYIERSLRENRKENVRNISREMASYNRQVGSAVVDATLNDMLSTGGNPADPEPRKVTGRRTKHVIPKSTS